MALVTNRRRGVTNRTGRVFEQFTINVGGDGAKVQEGILEGRKHLKVPVTIIVEGVLNGSHGPGLYLAEESGKFVSRWNHMPLTLNHPTVQGKRVSARTPKILDRFKVGILLNVRQEKDKTKGFAYFDIQRTKSLDSRVLDRIKKGEKVEVSTGLHLSQEVKAGVHNGEKYAWIARDHEPDHLAVLLDSVGASPVSKGAGLLANQLSLPDSMSQTLRRSIEEVVKTIGVEKVVGNEMSFSAVSVQLSRALAAAYGSPGEYWRGYVCEVFPDYVVYSGDDGKTYKVGYKTTKTTVELTGDAVEVARQVSYVPVSNSVPSPEEGDMAFDKKKHVDGLIGNGYDESDRVELEKVPDAILQKITPKNPVANATAPPVVVPPTGEFKLTWDEIKKVMPPQKLAAMEFGEQTITNLRSQSIETIKKAKGNKLSPEQLAGLPTDVLTNMAAMTADESVQSAADEDVYNNGFAPGTFFNMPSLAPPTKDPIEKVADQVANDAGAKPVKGPLKWNYAKRPGAAVN